MRTARVEYATGREVLRDYWGYLASGGLLLPEPVAQQLAPDGEVEPVVLEVRIASLRKEYRVAGRAHRRDDGRVVVAFDGQPQDLLNAVWADGQGVPERRHRRYEVDLEVRFTAPSVEGTARVMNLSRGGCCLRVRAPMRGGTRIVLQLDGFLLWGRVRWTGGSGLAGVEFECFQEALVARHAACTTHPAHLHA